jgi:hypothetical protein
MGARACSGTVLLLVLLLLVVQASSGSPAGDNGQAYDKHIDILRNPQLLTAAKTYQQLMQHKHSLSSGALQRSLVYRGANLRLRKVLNKLIAGGQGVRFGAIGGSITCVSCIGAVADTVDAPLMVLRLDVARAPPAVLYCMLQLPINNYFNTGLVCNK